MSDLRFFADTMYELITVERRLKTIERQAQSYKEICFQSRKHSLPITDRIPVSFHKANEGICAVEIILRK